MSPERLSRTATEAIVSEENTLALSLVSLWEMTIKAAKGQLELPEQSIAEVAKELSPLGIALLGLHLSDMVVLESLPPTHKDPFYRLLVAQAISHGFVLVSSDTKLGGYDTPSLW